MLQVHCRGRARRAGQTEAVSSSIDTDSPASMPTPAITPEPDTQSQLPSALPSAPLPVTGSLPLGLESVPTLHRSCHQWLQGAFPEHSVFSVPQLSSLASWHCLHYLGCHMRCRHKYCTRSTLHRPLPAPACDVHAAAPKFCPRPFSFLPACGSGSTKMLGAAVAGSAMPHTPRESSIPSAHHVPSLGTPPGPSR